jgi:hypothetical protein
MSDPASQGEVRLKTEKTVPQHSLKTSPYPSPSIKSTPSNPKIPSLPAPRIPPDSIPIGWRFSSTGSLGRLAAFAVDPVVERAATKNLVHYVTSGHPELPIYQFGAILQPKGRFQQGF